MADHNIWKHVKVDPDSIKNNPYLNPVQPSTSPPIVEPPTSYQSTTPLVGIYSTIEGSTYANAVHELQDSLRSNPSQVHPIFISSSGTKLFRPLTYKENIEARINDFETKKNPDDTLRTDDELQELFKVYLDSCTGFAYKKDTTKFKINSICSELITIDEAFTKTFKSVDYNSFQGVELDSKDDVYNSLLTKTQFLNHKGYGVLYDDDVSLMNAYWDIVHSLTSRDELLGLRVRQNTTKDELLALYVSSGDDISDADGGNGLYANARFLRVAPREKK